MAEAQTGKWRRGPDSRGLMVVYIPIDLCDTTQHDKLVIPPTEFLVAKVDSTTKDKTQRKSIKQA